MTKAILFHHSAQLEPQLNLDEMLGVLANDSQRKIYVASILENEKEYLQVIHEGNLGWMAGYGNDA